MPGRVGEEGRLRDGGGAWWCQSWEAAREAGDLVDDEDEGCVSVGVRERWRRCRSRFVAVEAREQCGHVRPMTMEASEASIRLLLDWKQPPVREQRKTRAVQGRR